MAYRVAIVDDSNIDAEYVQSIVNAWARERQAGVQTQRFASAENFLFHYAEDKEWDILLLDIEMGAMDGISLAKRIRQDNETVQIVFVTGFGDYISEGYEVSALHYLMKPVKQEKLFAVIAGKSLAQRYGTATASTVGPFGGAMPSMKVVTPATLPTFTKMT